MKLESFLLLLVLFWVLGGTVLYSANRLRLYGESSQFMMGLVEQARAEAREQEHQRALAALGHSRYNTSALPPLCAWRPRTCTHLREEGAAINRWLSNQQTMRPITRFQNSEACRGERALRVHLRGKQFRSWWGHVTPRISHGASQHCPVPCDVIYDTERPLGLPDIVVDTLAPSAGLREPEHQALALVALENGGGQGGTHSTRNMDRIDLLSTWMRAGDVPINYMYAWHNLCGVVPRGDGSVDYGAELERCSAPVPDQDLLERKKMAAAFISNCRAGERTAFFKALLRHLPPQEVDSWGKCMRTEGLPSEAKRVREDQGWVRSRAKPSPGSGADAQRGVRKIALLEAGYKFAFAFENSVRYDYVTEKALHPLLAAVVPVVWGAPDVDDFFPGGAGSYINALDFPSPKALADYLIEVAADDELYLRYFDWRTSRGGPGPTREFLALQEQSFVAEDQASWPCRLCQAYRNSYCDPV